MFTTFVAALVMTPQHKHGHGHMHQKGHMSKPVNEEPGIRAGYADAMRGFNTKNWSLLRSRMTSNFQQELPNHKVMNAKATLAMLRQQFAPMSDIKVVMDVQQIKVEGSTATTQVRFSGDAKMKDKKGTHKVHMEGSETDTLKKVGGRWMASYLKMHDQSMSMDGHVVMHMP